MFFATYCKDGTIPKCLFLVVCLPMHFLLNSGFVGGKLNQLTGKCTRKIPILLSNRTRRKTSISSKAFVALPTDKRTKYLENRYSFMRGICSKKLKQYLN